MMMLLTMLLVLSGPLSRESCKPLIGFNEPPSPCAACSFGICKYAFKGVRYTYYLIHKYNLRTVRVTPNNIMRMRASMRWSRKS